MARPHLIFVLFQCRSSDHIVCVHCLNWRAKIVLVSCNYYRRGSLDFLSVAPALLFGLFVCWPLNPAVCGTERSVNSRIKSKHYCSCRYPPLGIGFRIQTMRGWDGGVGEGWDGEGAKGMNREKEREWERMGGWTSLSVLEHSGLSAIWWRWSEELKINNLLDMCPEKVWPKGPWTAGFVWDACWIYFETFQSFSQCQCYSGSNQVKWLINLSKMQSNLI